MHQRLVMEQLRAVIDTETGTAAQADAGGTGGSLGDQCRVQHHVDDAAVEKIVKIVLQLQLQRSGRHRHLFFWCQQLVVQLLRNADEMPRRLARGRAIAGHGLLRRTE